MGNSIYAAIYLETKVFDKSFAVPSILLDLMALSYLQNMRLRWEDQQRKKKESSQVAGPSNSWALNICWEKLKMKLNDRIHVVATGLQLSRKFWLQKTGCWGSSTSEVPPTNWCLQPELCGMVGMLKPGGRFRMRKYYYWPFVPMIKISFPKI